MEGIDCATKLTAQTAGGLKAAGIAAAGRYLGRNSWKGLTPPEVEAVHNAGLSLWLIWETAPTKASYFSYPKGISDGKAAAAEAEYLGAPQGTAIYFTVDYDAQPGDMAAIAEYFHGVRDGVVGNYAIGAYGSYSVLTALARSGHAPDKYYQTYAWSHSQVYSGHIYQYQNNVQLAGVTVDKDHIYQAPGAWPEVWVDAPSTGTHPPVQQQKTLGGKDMVRNQVYKTDQNGDFILDCSDIKEGVGVAGFSSGDYRADRFVEFAVVEELGGNKWHMKSNIKSGLVRILYVAAPKI